MTVLLTLLVCVALFAGWRLRDLELITPESGLGYALGILGTCLIVILLLYSVRKRLPKLEHAGHIKIWFRMHMLLGVLGPVLILFHANFRLGALNSNVALFAMFVVVASGLLGRFLYRKIHRGLDGRRATLIELRGELEHAREDVGPLFALVPRLKDELFGFSDQVLAACPTVPDSFKRVVAVGWRANGLRWKTRRAAHVHLLRHAVQHDWSPSQAHTMRVNVKRKISRFLAQTVRVAQFSFYERVFALWHVLHIPLVVMIAITVTIHVIAVHLY